MIRRATSSRSPTRLAAPRRTRMMGCDAHAVTRLSLWDIRALSSPSIGRPRKVGATSAGRPCPLLLRHRENRHRVGPLHRRPFRPSRFLYRGDTQYCVSGKLSMSQRIGLRELFPLEWYDGVVSGVGRWASEVGYCLATRLAFDPDRRDRIYGLVDVAAPLGTKLSLYGRVPPTAARQPPWPEVRAAVARGCARRRGRWSSLVVQPSRPDPRVAIIGAHWRNTMLA